MCAKELIRSGMQEAEELNAGGSLLGRFALLSHLRGVSLVRLGSMWMVCMNADCSG